LVILTSHGNEQIAVEAMKAGALDYVVKSPETLSGMPRVMDRTLREWQLLLDRQRAEEERRRAQEERRRLESRLEQSQKLESLGILAAGVAHDFNNLVMAMMGRVQIALAELPKGSSGRQSLLEIELAAGRAAELCKQLLAYSGRGRFVMETIDLNSLASEMVQILDAAIADTVDLRLELTPRLPSLEAAATQIRQIVMNLILNASDSLGGAPGSVTVRTGTEPSAPAEAKGASTKGVSPGQRIFLEVADTGCGMNIETQKRIFDPFFTTKTDGRGLGLAAIQGIVRSHRGAIELDSRPGQGTTFRVLFPTPPRTHTQRGCTTIECAPRSSSDRDRESSGAEALLVIDDDDTIRAVTMLTLEGAGFLVYTAENGDHGLKILRHHRENIVAVLLDLNMPNQNGEHTLGQLLQVDSDLRVIACSGCEESEARRRLGDIAGFIQKPFSAEELIQGVRRVLAR
jgi:signal transduction histidine kinase